MPSLLEGIEAKYGRESDSSELDIPILYVPRKSQDYVPPILVFNDFGIDSAGSEEKLKCKCQNVQELDLAQNSLSQWAEVMTILRIMPRLQFVNLSFNSLSQALTDELLLSDCFPRLKNLILNGTYIDWPSVRKLLTYLPNLEELHLSLNGYSYVELEELEDGVSGIHPGVKSLYFTDNTISSWREVCKLGIAFPNLHSLILADCPINSLDVTSPDSTPERQYSRTESECESATSSTISPHHTFRNLKFLNLNNTLLSSWEDIDRLACFPNLAHLRIHGLPLFEYPQEYTKHERRQLLIARLPNIRTLNGGGEIGVDDREDAERAFIRHYMDKPESDRPERYSDLVAVHGRLDPLVNIDLSPERKVKVNIVYGSKSEIRCLDVYQTVFELKQKLESFANISAAKMKLFYVDQELKVIHGPEEMRFPNKQLYSYNITFGDEIIVDSKI
ncbi:tubulin-specific chaperone cofactor E-like protein isoform X1 [Halyomorpha halys]|uniref:tubulin-specific chaperone cofactor E-like protein isoform X1 n=1 Tax=Halyomorpha halys TaxID=286706 RepID=UPI0006D4FD57|nr:tubulin-specific chaperone cofactor E-like protein isoform X1 [Halyomorpha halys]XP_014284970.1 tubulin-specific chaperone cofactor E-like protein isoform X1 [Halyomorpha halys]XP_014284971.1 tubulin-specific chaperone cofactor E-like protein isoform X1 [Halyomorpha halys]